MTKQNTISPKFKESVKNAYGSFNNFEQALIFTAYRQGNKGYIYFGINRYLNLEIESSKTDQIFPLLTLDLNNYDIYNFIEEIDYASISAQYVKYRALIESDQIINF